VLYLKECKVGGNCNEVCSLLGGLKLGDVAGYGTGEAKQSGWSNNRNTVTMGNGVVKRRSVPHEQSGHENKIPKEIVAVYN
jgi:hypothetical protein